MVGSINRVMRGAIWAFLAVSLAVAPARAQIDDGAGTAGFTFLTIPQSARLVALGTAAVAEVNDEAAFQLNPAGFAQQRLRRWSATYANLFTDVQSGFLTYSQAVGMETTVGAALTYLSSGGIPKRGLLNEDLGTYSFSDAALTLSVGTRVVGSPDTLSARVKRRLKKSVGFRLDAGVSVKGIYEKLDTYSASGFAVDLGVLAHLPDDRTRIGLSVINLGAQTSAFIDEADDLPIAFITGLRHELREAPLLVTADIRVPTNNKVRFGVGGELKLGATRNRPAPIALRAGYSSQGRDLKTTAEDSGIAGFSFGLGLRWRTLLLDYSFTPGLGLGTLHRFTLAGNVGS